MGYKRSCHCGSVAYEVEGNLEQVLGEPKIYVKTAQSGTRRAHAFCPDCDGPVYSSAVSDPPTYSLRVGCLDRRADLPPQRQIWCDSALPWGMDIREATQLPRQ